MITLPETPTLTVPSTGVRTSYLVGEQADMIHRGSSTAWLAEASNDFDGYVAQRVGVRERMGVPSEVFWFTAGEFYLGSLVIRHRLPEGGIGGHVGYHVVRPWQGQGYATRMLGQALPKLHALGVERALLTVDPANTASLTVVRRHGGVEDGVNGEGEVRLWVETSAQPSRWR